MSLSYLCFCTSVSRSAGLSLKNINRVKKIFEFIDYDTKKVNISKQNWIPKMW